VKALVIRNPYAWCISRVPFDPDAKTVENRNWSTPHRGDLAIVEGRALDRDALDHPLVTRAIDYWAGGRGAVRGEWETARGVVVAVVRLHAVCLRSRGKPGLCTCGPWAVSRQAHWRLDRVRPLPVPVPVRGRQGLFNLPADVESAVRAQIEPQESASGRGVPA
jgi:hypothetical protein